MIGPVIQAVSPYHDGHAGHVAATGFDSKPSLEHRPTGTSPWAFAPCPPPTWAHGTRHAGVEEGLLWTPIVNMLISDFPPFNQNDFHGVVAEQYRGSVYCLDSRADATRNIVPDVIHTWAAPLINNNP